MKRQINRLKQINVMPLASESFGVRSMCTFVQTPDVALLLDAGVSLCPWRFNLPPHPVEFQAIESFRKKIANAADKAQIITLSHYHYDHHTPSFEDWIVNWTVEKETARQIYQDKTLLIKSPMENINSSQQGRAKVFLKTGAKYAKEVHEADGKVFRYGNTQIHCSKVVPHGEDNSAMGYVIMTTIDYGDERFMFAPDVQGPMSNCVQQQVLESRPLMIMLGGPPFYLADFRVSNASLQNAVSNLRGIVEAVPVTIVEHHALRDEFFKQKMVSVQICADGVGHEFLTAAEFVGCENRFLEVGRRSLYELFPPSEEFRVWMKCLGDGVFCRPPI
ncbi:MAG: hypothetical protein FWF27_06010 [Candidatus Bathyarchaeota archaeon]|nr:hypothetical protein [Candidatus Termiticorpusculum sp.]